MFSIGCFTGCDNKSTGNVSNESTPTADGGSSPDATVKSTFNTTTSPTVTDKTSSATPTNGNGNAPVPNVPNTPAVKQNTPVPTAKSTHTPVTPTPTARITPAPTTPTPTAMITPAPTTPTPTATPTPSHTVVPIKDANAGDYVVLGTYEQDNNISNGKEDIEWLVLERKDNKIFVVSKYALDYQKYHYSWSDDITWESCTLRKWLNNDFFNAAFTDDEKAMIPTVTVSADKNPNYVTHPGNATKDKVFLLSIAEINNYGAIKCPPSAYLRAQRDFTSVNPNVCYWWTRSPGKEESFVANIVGIGFVNYEGDICNSRYYVRPAMWISTN